MPVIQIISVIGFPLLMFIGGIAAWRMSRNQTDPKVEKEKAAWRDDSLDDWRKERDRTVEVEREQRVENAASGLYEGAGGGGDGGDTIRHQRIGG